jgi:hypothetical protein
MRVGCSGCLSTIVILALLSTVAAGVWGTSRALEEPGVATVTSTAGDAARAQQKLFRLMNGTAREPVVLSEAEVNAFVARNVDPRDLPFEEPSVFLRSDGVVELVGRVPLRRLLAESPLPLVADVLPAAWLAKPVWLRLVAHTRFERDPSAQLRLDVRRVTLGRQALPPVALRLFFEPTSLRFARVSLPTNVADVRIESGRAVIRATSSRGRT